MNIYRIQEADFVLPEGWQDQTINIFSSAGEAPGGCSFVITRSPTPDDMGLVAYMDQQIAQLADRLPKFRLINRSNLTIDTVPAEQAEFVWSGEHGPMRQLQTCLFLRGIVLTLTGTAPEATYLTYESSMLRTLYSIKL